MGMNVFFLLCLKTVFLLNLLYIDSSIGVDSNNKCLNSTIPCGTLNKIFNVSELIDDSVRVEIMSNDKDYILDRCLVHFHDHEYEITTSSEIKTEANIVVKNGVYSNCESLLGVKVSKGKSTIRNIIFTPEDGVSVFVKSNTLLSFNVIENVRVSEFDIEDPYGVISIFGETFSFLNSHFTNNRIFNANYTLSIFEGELNLIDRAVFEGNEFHYYTGVDISNGRGLPQQISNSVFTNLIRFRTSMLDSHVTGILLENCKFTLLEPPRQTDYRHSWFFIDTYTATIQFIGCSFECVNCYTREEAHLAAVEIRSCSKIEFDSCVFTGIEGSPLFIESGDVSEYGGTILIDIQHSIFTKNKQIDPTAREYFGSSSGLYAYGSDEKHRITINVDNTTFTKNIGTVFEIYSRVTLNFKENVMVTSNELVFNDRKYDFAQFILYCDFFNKREKPDVNFFSEIGFRDNVCEGSARCLSKDNPNFLCMDYGINDRGVCNVTTGTEEFLKVCISKKDHEGGMNGWEIFLICLTSGSFALLTGFFLIVFCGIIYNKCLKSRFKKDYLQINGSDRGDFQ